SYSPKVTYHEYEVTEAPEGNWARTGDIYIIADKLADEVMRQARVTAYEQRAAVTANDFAQLVAVHPLAAFHQHYRFPVPLLAVAETRWVPPQGENRLRGMIETRPDWVISRQRAWGVPITVFVREKGDGSVDILRDTTVNARVAAAFEQEGADAWYAEGAA